MRTENVDWTEFFRRNATRSHSEEAIKAAVEAGTDLYSFIAGPNSDEDDTLIDDGDGISGVERDIMAHFDIDDAPENWMIEKINMADYEN